MIGDHLRRYERAIDWNTADAGDLPRVRGIVEGLEQEARADLEAAGFAPDQIRLTRTGTFQFLGQVWQLPMVLPEGELGADTGEQLATAFPAVYERNYGSGTAWEGAPVILVDVALDAVGIEPKPTPEPSATTAGRPEPARTRVVFLPDAGAEQEIPIYDDVDVLPGAELDGPCIIEADDTTVYVPADTSIRRDEHWNLHMAIAL
jgi:N-methylhydantoinase A